jgi:mannose-1-phosphate guanylyltransferase
MQALLLVGGEATRLRPLTCNMPKAMVPVLNAPFLEHVIRYLSGHGVNDIVLAQGHLPKLMDDCFYDGKRLGVKLTYSLEPKPMGTGGAIKYAERYLDDCFLVLNGDIFTDLDLTSMLRFHKERRAKATISLTPVEDPTAYGVIETTADARVKRFLEKPKREEVTTNMINAGTLILSKEVLRLIPPETNYSYERQLFPQLLQMGEMICGFPSPAYWIDIGKPETYFQLHRDLLQGKVKGYIQDKAIKAGKGCNIHPEAQITGQVVIGDDCAIGRGAKLNGPLVIGPGNIIEEDAVIESSITWQNTHFGVKTNIRECLIANECAFDNNVCMEKSVIGDHVKLSRNTRLGPGSRIWPPGWK